MTSIDPTIRLRFTHGLGDCSNFAHVLGVFESHGYDFEVSCSPDKHVVFAPCAKVVDLDYSYPEVPWWDAGWADPETADKYWTYNKIGINLCEPMLPSVATAQEMWQEVCDVRLDTCPHIPRTHRIEVDQYVGELPRPIILLHTDGNTNHDSKSIPGPTTYDLYKALLESTDGTLVLLDWDNRVPRLSNWRVRHLADDWKLLETTHLLALLQVADLMVGVDSGPLHTARFTNIPTVGVFPTIGHYPARYCLPRPRQVNVVPRDTTHPWNRTVRINYNIVECGGEQIDPDFVANTCVQMLQPPRYLSSQDQGADVQLQQFVLDWERGHPNGLSGVVDRHRGFDLLLKELSKRASTPLVVETGCIRSSEDWRGAGYSTYLFGAMLHRYGGTLISVDNNSDYCRFASKATAELKSVFMVCQDSISFLSQFDEPIDLLYLDSLDSDHPSSADHALTEVKAGMRLMHAKSLIAFDDTVYSCRQFTGKGAKAVPWLINEGWRIIHSGYQTILAQ